MLFRQLFIAIFVLFSDLLLFLYRLLLFFSLHLLHFLNTLNKLGPQIFTLLHLNCLGCFVLILILSIHQMAKIDVLLYNIDVVILLSPMNDKHMVVHIGNVPLFLTVLVNYTNKRIYRRTSVRQLQNKYVENALTKHVDGIVQQKIISLFKKEELSTIKRVSFQIEDHILGKFQSSSLPLIERICYRSTHNIKHILESRKSVVFLTIYILLQFKFSHLLWNYWLIRRNLFFRP